MIWRRNGGEMPWVQRGAVVFLLVCGIGATLSCGGDDGETTGPPQEEDLTSEEVSDATAVVNELAAIFQLANAVSGFVGSAVNRPPPLATEVDLAAVTCPDVQVQALVAGWLQVDVDFGAGCAMASGVTASGKLQITYRALPAAPDTIGVSLDAFNIQGYEIDGSMGATGELNEWDFHFEGTIAHDASSTQIDAALGVATDMAGTPTIPEDDTTGITGSIQYANSEGQYLAQIADTLIFVVECSYPMAGILTYQEIAEHATPVTTIDFSAGDCCTAQVSISNRSQDIDFCTGD